MLCARVLTVYGVRVGEREREIVGGALINGLLSKKHRRLGLVPSAQLIPFFRALFVFTFFFASSKHRETDSFDQPEKRRTHQFHSGENIKRHLIEIKSACTLHLHFHCVAHVSACALIL